jgi:hypothetical protein
MPDRSERLRAQRTWAERAFADEPDAFAIEASRVAADAAKTAKLRALRLAKEATNPLARREDPVGRESKGRKPIARAKAGEVSKLHAEGLSIAKIAKQLEIGKASVFRILHA